MEVESRIFKVLDKIFEFSIQCQGKEKLDLGNCGLLALSAFYQSGFIYKLLAIY